MKVVPGETALAFYKAQNLSDKNVIGVATYNVVPPRAGDTFTRMHPRNDDIFIHLYTYLY